MLKPIVNLDKTKVSVLVVLLGVIAYGMYHFNSSANQVNRVAREDIMRWYESTTLSENDILLEATKNYLKLDSSWNFRTESIELNDLELSKFFITRERIFLNENINTYLFVRTYYYYDLDTIFPVPLKEEAVKYSEDSVYETVLINALWHGDFDTTFWSDN